MSGPPDFVIIGAMKCGTSTLQAQLAAQPGVFMTTPKEPNFFSDDPVYAQGPDWYRGLYADAAPDDLRGEASTHYAKLPTHPDTVARLAAAAPRARLIYVLRDPLDRLVSHYIHEWTMGVITDDLETALTRHPELVDYGRYAMQIAPFVDRFGAERIHLSSLERIKADPEGEIAAVGRFLGAPAPFVWRRDLPDENVSAQRVRDFPLRRLLVANPVARALRRTLVPKSVRAAVKGRFQMRERPVLSAEARARLAPVFAEDRTRLAALLPAAAARIGLGGPEPQAEPQARSRTGP